MAQYNVKLTMEFDSTYFESDSGQGGEIFADKSLKEQEFLEQNKSTTGTAYFTENSYFVERMFDNISSANEWLQFVQSTITNHPDLDIVLKSSNIENV